MGIESFGRAGSHLKTGASRFKESYFSYVLVFFFYYFCIAVFSSVLSVYLTDIGKSASEMSFIISSSGLFSFAVVPVAGYAVDRTGKPKLISAVLLLAAGALGLVFAVCRQVWALFLLNGLIMSLINSVSPVCERMAGSCRFRYGSLRVWGTLGYAVGAQAAGLVLDLGAPLLIFVLLAVSVLLTVLGFWGTGWVRAPAREETPEEGEKPKFSSLLRSPQFLLFLVIALLFQGCSGVNMTYVPVLLTTLGIPAGAVGTALFFSTLVEIPIILFSNKFMDRFSGKTLLLLSFGVIISQFLLYGLSRSAWLTVAVMVLLKAVASTMFVMITLKVVRNVIGPQFTTTGLAVVNSANNLGIIAFQNLGGMVADRTDVFTVYLCMAALTGVGMVLTLFLKVRNDEKVFS